MKTVTRRRFLQFAASTPAQAQPFARWALQGTAAAFLGACRSFRRAFSAPVRWVVPSTSGDFVLLSRHDPREVREFPLRIWAERFQFPAVAATRLEGGGPADIDSDQVELTDVWVIIDARPGTRLFRERDIVRSDLLSAQPSGDFTLEVAPQSLFPALGDVVPLTVAIAGAPEARKWFGRAPDRRQLLRFEFCVHPDACQAGGSAASTVRSTLPTVTARWPRLDLLIRPAGADTEHAQRIHQEPALQSERADLHECGGPPRELRWVAVQFVLPAALELAVREHANRDLTVVRIEPQTVKVRLRPGFVDLLIPAGSTLERRRGASVIAGISLRQSHLHAANLYAFAWASDMPAETTTLPAELSSAFCFCAQGPGAWPLVEAIELPQSGSRIELEVAAEDVARARVAVTLANGGARAARSVEQEFRRATLVFRSARGELAPRLTLAPQGLQVATLAIFDDAGSMTAPASTATSDLVLVADLFTRVHAVMELDLRFHADRGSYVADASRLIFATREAAWAGRSSIPPSAGDWVHLNTTRATPTAGDYRADPAPLTGETTVQWLIDRDTFRITQPLVVAQSDAEIVALAPEAFRVAVSATLPRVAKTIALPPFALREHGDFRFGKWTPDAATGPKPAFKALTMWEPRTAGAATGDAHSPAELFASFAAAAGGATVRGVYAGFGIDGTLVPLRDREWAPDERCLAGALAPYRAIVADTMRPVEDAFDVLDLGNPLRSCVTEGFGEAQRNTSIQRVIRNPATEIALSPVGGTIRFDWQDEVQEIGLRDLVLHGWLGRYQKNYAIFSDLLLPYGIRYNVLTLTSRQDSGRLR
ncbi:MAG TPA: hypothetical protein VE075_04080, partial [Thermoanaerobaculia bacterium]|nr:hypothetical protein [Thermoanaerobaculia bacterium]